MDKLAFTTMRILDFYFSLDIKLDSAKETLEVLNSSKDYHESLKTQMSFIDQYNKNNLLEDGFAFSDYILYFLNSEGIENLQAPSDDYMEQLITTEYFKSLYDYAISTIDNSKIMKNIFYNLSSLEDLKKITPYLIILVEKYLRHLTDNQFSTKINIHKLREQVEKYLSDKKYIYKPYINTELLIDSDLFNQIQDKYNEAYYNNLRELIQNDFLSE